MLKRGHSPAGYVLRASNFLPFNTIASQRTKGARPRLYAPSVNRQPFKHNNARGARRYYKADSIRWAQSPSLDLSERGVMHLLGSCDVQAGFIENPVMWIITIIYLPLFTSRSVS